MMRRHYRDSAAGSFRVLYALLLGLASVGGALAADAAPTDMQAVPTLTVSVREAGRQISADGHIEATHQAVVAAQVTARITGVKVDAGDRVAAGQLLFELDSREAGESLAAASARQNQADAALARARDLQRRHFISAAAVDQAQAEADTARAARQAAEAALSHAEIRAPFAGIVASRDADVGDLASPGAPLLTIYRPGAARAVVQLPSAQAVAVRAAGPTLRATITLGGETQIIGANRIQVLPVADAATHVVEVRLELPSEVARRVVPGSAVRAAFAVGETASLTLPAAAIIHRGGIAAAYVRDGEGRFRLRQLRLGETVADGQVEILAGLVAGEVVALDPVKAGIERRRAAER